MNFLKQDREALERLLPGLDDELAAIPLMEMERPGNPAFAVFRKLGGPALLIPKQFGGCGASPVDAVRAQRAISCRAPSLAVATTMHHFTIASLMEISPEDPGLEAETLEAVARDNLYIGSGFAEGNGKSIITSSLRVERGAGGLILNGSKKPCSLSRSMDLFSFSAPTIEGMEGSLGVVTIPADTPGLERRAFWQSPILAGAESDEVVLHDVVVPEDALFPIGGSSRVNEVQDRGFLWFELLITTCYVGIVSAMAERVWAANRGNAAERVKLAIEIEGAMAGLEGIASGMMAGERGNSALARMLLVRYAVQGAVARAAAIAVELLGGMAMMRSAEVSYLLAATHILSLHPPPRIAASTRLDEYLSGSQLALD